MMIRNFFFQIVPTCTFSILSSSYYFLKRFCNNFCFDIVSTAGLLDNEDSRVGIYCFYADYAPTRLNGRPPLVRECL